MKVLLVNAVCGRGSTGRICTDIHNMLLSKGASSMIAFAHSTPTRISVADTYRINDVKGYYVHNALARITDRAGFYSTKATKRFIRFIERYKPDLIHLHNLHGFYINVEILFNFLATSGIPVVWTLHDCWSFTGHCAYFSYQGCFKWVEGCSACPLKKEYPQSLFFDSSFRNYIDKKRLFTSVKNLTITTPSNWLAGEVKKSFLGGYPIFPIYNGIDLSVFKPTDSDIKEKYGIPQEKKMLLSVANDWSKRKGLDDLKELNNMLDHVMYQMVIVGLSSKQMDKLSKDIIAVQRTDSVEELVALYSAADAFINPSYEETMGMVTAEAMACGTPVVVYDKTAVPEIADFKSGVVVPAGNIEAILKALPKAMRKNSSDCVKRAHEFEMNQQYEKYYQLYRNILQR